MIHMQQNTNDINILFPKFGNIENLKRQVSFEPFSDESIDFLNALYNDLSKHAEIRLYPDVATFAFYCRKANILRLKKKHFDSQFTRIGRGLVFHIAPSNVPVNFAYSLLCGILSGNSNIVRLPSKDFRQVSIICESLQKISSKYNDIASRNFLVKYDKSSTATNFFSSLCNVRIIWGGDETILQIRKSNLPPRSFDMTFADRYSIAIINAGQYLSGSNYEKVASDFYNDTYLFDQNACTAPHLVIWFGTNDQVNKAKNYFWENLHEMVIKKYGDLPSVVAVDKLTAFYNQAAQNENIQLVESKDNLLWRIELRKLALNIDQFRSSCGYFSEYHTKSLEEIAKIISNKYQTLAYLGFEKQELINFVRDSSITGIDRIVPIGHTTDFSLIWDGFDLINILTRVIDY